MADTHASAFSRALTELLAVAVVAPGGASKRFFRTHRHSYFLRHHDHQDAADEVHPFCGLDSPRSRAASSDGESTTSSSSSTSSHHKCSLAFILASSDAIAGDDAADSFEEQPASPVWYQTFSFADPHHIRIPDESVSPSSASSSSGAMAAALNSHTPTSEQAKMKKRRRLASSKPVKSCKLETSASANSTVCTSGTAVTVTSTGASAALSSTTSSTGGAPVKKGSKYCIVEGCGSRAKHARRCWKHGGSVKCKMATCSNRAKTKGVCWSHGGGTICSFANCATISVSNGVCWAHGGGKRCAIEGCARPAYERTENLCSLHFDDKSKIVAGAAAAVTQTKPKAGKVKSR